MAKDVITRFKLETTQYDSKLKTARGELATLDRQIVGPKDFNDFTQHR